MFLLRIFEMSMKKFAMLLCCVALVSAGVAEAKKLKIKNLPVADTFPGVDDFGDLDFGNTFDGLVNVVDQPEERQGDS